MNENKREIVFWDDAGILFHKPDTLEKIKEDAIKIFEETIEALEASDLMWISSYTALRKIHIRNVFLIQLSWIIKRIEKLNDGQ